jgi:predicted dehydrogenase
MLHIGIAGVGGLGQLHLKNYLARPDVAVTALATRTGTVHNVDTNLGAGHPSFDIGSIRCDTGYESLCDDPAIDVVSVNLPTDLHAAAVIRALENGKHVFSEKPMALAADDARAMIAAAETADRRLMIGHCLRFAPVYLAAEKVIRGGAYGRPLLARFTRSGGIPTWGSQNWFQDPARSGGAVVDLHIHDIDLCVWWWGRPQSITATGVDANLVHSAWRYADGPAVQFESTWEPATSSPFRYSFQVVFEHATLMFDSRNDHGLQLARDKEVVPVDVAEGCPYAAEDNYFLDVVIDGKGQDALGRCPLDQSRVSLECALETARQLEA